MKAMSKTTKKKRNTYNQDIINILSKKYNTAPQYVRQSIRGDSKSIMSDDIRKEYKYLDKKAKEVVNQ